MKAITDTWFECKIKHDVTLEDGSTKPQKVPYIVNAFSFTEAEAKINQEISAYMSAFEINDIKKATFNEVFFDDTDALADKWYKVKVTFIFADEKTGKEKPHPVNYLVQAADFNCALKNVNTIMSTNLGNWSVDSISVTKILDVFYGTGSKNIDDKPEYEQ